MSQVARNQVWREHVNRENTHLVVREAFFINPASLAPVTDKPHHPYHARLSHRDYNQMSAQSHQKYADAKMQLTSRAAARAGAQIISPREAPMTNGQQHWNPAQAPAPSLTPHELQQQAS